MEKGLKCLPLEIRLMIWNLTSSRESSKSSMSQTLDSSPNTSTRRSRHMPGIQKSSRTQYPTCFGTSFNPSRLRFNYALDILYISPELGGESTAAFFDRMQEKDFFGLRNVAIHEEAFLGRITCGGEVNRALPMMKNVEREIVVVERKKYTKRTDRFTPASIWEGYDGVI